MKRISGKFHGTGAAVYICCGFVPDAVKLVNVENDTPNYLWWNRMMADASQLSIEGIYRDENGGALGDLAAGAGIQPYYGNPGSVLTATQVGTTTYGEGVFLKEDRRDYRYSQDRTHEPGDALNEDIVKWTSDGAAVYTGYFNEDVVGTYIGPGSPIIIDGKMYMINTLAAGEGEATTEVTLNVAGVTGSAMTGRGQVQFIGGMYGYKPMLTGEFAKSGFLVNDVAVNVDGDMVVFDAWVWDSD